MEYLHDALSVMPIDFRIIRNVTGKGRFASIEDIEAIENIASATIYYRPAAVEADVFTINYRFAEAGDFIGIVSARNPESGKSYAAVFPFEVGFTGWGYWPFFIALLLLVQLQYLFMTGRLKRWFAGSPAAAVFLLLLFPGALLADNMVVSYTTADGDPVINRMHTWILHIEDESGVGIEGATVAVNGGMPAHSHGLPTKPRVTADLGGGDYRLEGVRFHMRGSWEMVISITTESGTTIVKIPLQL